jgi:hypothetical protein
MRIELNCAQCGQNRFTLLQGMEDGGVVLCVECGHSIGTMEELKERLAEEVLKRSSIKGRWKALPVRRVRNGWNGREPDTLASDMRLKGA